jgi:hypothetical protein
MKPKYKLYYVSLYDGFCGLHANRTLRAAKSEVLKTKGTENLKSVSLATNEEIDWIKAMGGYIPNIDVLNEGNQ